MVHSDASIFYSADKDAEFVLSFRVFHQFGLDAESPHLFQIVARQLDLVESFAADFDQFVTWHLSKLVIQLEAFQNTVGVSQWK